ncbi:Ycg1 [Kluyveromyces lactis]|nr:Ycg1 [Kluyveromyces lactis]
MDVQNGESPTNRRVLNSIAEVFQVAQKSYAGHRRHVAVLYRIYLKCMEQEISDVFHYWFIKMTVKILPLKKQEIVGDRIVRLISGFIANIESNLNKMRTEDGNEQKLRNLEVHFGGFIDGFVRNLLRGVESKNKNVRYRVMQLLAATMDNMGEIDEELYELIMWVLKHRVYDKEPHVRIQAIFCLTKFQNDNVSMINESETGVNFQLDEATQSLMHIIRNDPSPEVRRAAMLNIVRSKATQNVILERVRDVNFINRRLVFTRVLKSLGKHTFDEVDADILEKLMTWGFEDRDETVRNSCKKLVAFTWLNILDGDIIDLLENIDVVNSTYAEQALYALFEQRPDVIEKVKFPKEVWETFTVETVFLLKCFFFHCLNCNLVTIIEENFPEALQFAEYLAFYLNKRVGEDETLSKTDYKYLDFILHQLLEIAYKYDFSDEVGRRDMLNIVRNFIGKAVMLNDDLIRISLKVLKILSINERDFVTMTVEIINDIKYDDIEKQELQEARSKEISARGSNSMVDDDEDEEMDDNAALESFHSAVGNLVSGKPVEENEHKDEEDEAEREIRPQTLITCLRMSRHLLEQINTSLDENVIVSSLIDTLITPAVRNPQPEIRELGVRCLGLCCLLDLQLATESIYILGMCVSKGNASLKHIALQVIVDIFSVHGTKVVDGEGKVDSISLHKIFYKILKTNDLPECQAIAAEGLCKLFLGDIFTDDDLFETLVLSYFSPVNSTNEALIQAFAFCLPVYCLSHVNHQSRMSRIAADVLLRLTMLWDELQNSDTADSFSKDSMLKPNEIFHQLIYWCDPRGLVNSTEEIVDSNTSQVDFLIDVLTVFERFERKDVKKMLLMNIQKFSVTPKQPKVKLLKIKQLLEEIMEYSSIDKLCKNAITNFMTKLYSILSNYDENGEEVDLSHDMTNGSLGETGTVTELSVSEISNNGSKASTSFADSNVESRGTKRSRDSDSGSDPDSSLSTANTPNVSKSVSFAISDA